MKRITTSHFASLVAGELTGLPGLEISEPVTDSRQLTVGDGHAFFAIRGVNHDGHRFIRTLYERGLRIFVVEQLPDDYEEYSLCSFIKVRNTVAALQQLAHYRRGLYTGKVIGVTGSTGKTIVKEWLAEILGSAFRVVRSPKSYNSQIGVPLSVWRMDDTSDVAIIEAGISAPGEMTRLESIIRPEIGIITNIGDAHGENFVSPDHKASEKLLLFSGCRSIVYCTDHQVIHHLITADKFLSLKDLAGWSFEDPNSRFYIRKHIKAGKETWFNVVSEDASFDFSIPFTDRASQENAAAVAVAAVVAGAGTDRIQKGMETLLPVAMRMEIKNGIGGSVLIADYYNSDPGSLRMAVDYLVAQNARRKMIVLSDFIQSGRNEAELYGEIAELVRKAGISSFIGIGPALSRNRSFFGSESRFYDSTDDFIHHLRATEFRDALVLLKGARRFEFERIGMALEQQVHQTMLEINLDAISHNLAAFRRRISPGTGIMAMVKAFAYGAGPSEIASLLEYHRIDYLAVAYADEGIDLREAGVSAPVVVMNPEPSAFALMVRYSLEPEIYSLSLLKQFDQLAIRHGLADFPVHIKVDTGMHRLGLLPSEVEAAIAVLTSSDRLKVASLFSHLSASEDSAFDGFTRKQAELFIEISDKLSRSLKYPFLKHLLNSAGVARFPEYQFDLIRPGIGLYGINTGGMAELRPAGRFVTTISQIKRVPAGEPVGYGCRDVSMKERTIAIIQAGYADGIDRRMGNGTGRLFINGGFAPIIGNVCMDMCMADITGIRAEEGDEAEIFGSRISVDEVAERCGTIPYEILTSIPPRVKRVFYRE